MKDLRPDRAPSDAKANIAHQDRVFTRKAFRLEELFDYGETFNEVTLNVSTYYHYRKIFDVIVDSPRAAVLELGCHTGKNLRYFAEKNPGVKTFGLDISFLSLLKAGANNVHGTGFLSGSAERLPFQEGCVDAVLCMDLLERLSDPAACLAEASRVLRRGGGRSRSNVRSRTSGGPRTHSAGGGSRGMAEGAVRDRPRRGAASSLR